jgi:hypothetical protein
MSQLSGEGFDIVDPAVNGVLSIRHWWFELTGGVFYFFVSHSSV